MNLVQKQVDQTNSQFWDELCGSQLAQVLGITDSSQESLAKYDDHFLQWYPYLLQLIQPERMRGKRILEIGLGYGTLGQKLAEAGVRYTGMDLASRPVEHMNWRLKQAGLPGRAVQGNALSMPFPDGTFDFLISIGCFHHTGSVQRCFDETYRVLRPGGVALLMVYNKFSFREWTRRPWQTLRAWLTDSAKGPTELSESCRAEYDKNSAGQPSPKTVLLSIGELKRMLRSFESVKFSKQNFDHLIVARRVLVQREAVLGTLGRWLGLDIYIEARKHLGGLQT